MKTFHKLKGGIHQLVNIRGIEVPVNMYTFVFPQNASSEKRDAILGGFLAISVTTWSSKEVFHFFASSVTNSELVKTQ